MGARVVLDTNVLVSGLGWPGASSKLVKLCLDETLRLVLSSEILRELERVLSYPKFKFSEKDVSEYLDILTQAAELVEPDFRLAAVPDDESDNRILECALAGGADAIVSGDRHLKTLGSYENIPILTPQAFLEEHDL